MKLESLQLHPVLVPHTQLVKLGMGRFAAAVSSRPFRRQPFRHGDVSPRPFHRHLNLITAVMIDSIFTEYATHISRNLNFILDHYTFSNCSSESKRLISENIKCSSD
jgi:hypothetical protein